MHTAADRHVRTHRAECLTGDTHRLVLVIWQVSLCLPLPSQPAREPGLATLNTREDTLRTSHPAQRHGTNPTGLHSKLINGDRNHNRGHPLGRVDGSRDAGTVVALSRGDVRTDTNIRPAGYSPCVARPWAPGGPCHQWEPPLPRLAGRALPSWAPCSLSWLPGRGSSLREWASRPAAAGHPGWWSPTQEGPRSPAAPAKTPVVQSKAGAGSAGALPREAG